MRRGRTIAVISASLAALALIPGARADVPMERQSIREGIAPHGGVAGATGTCSIVYWNLCSGWFWRYSPFTDKSPRTGGDELGVVFDLPEDCRKVPGTECTHQGFWWYWRSCYPGYGYTMTYDLFEVDENGCKVGSSLGTLPRQDPIERWNHYPGLGTTTADLVAIIGTMDMGAMPHWIADNNVKNSQAPIACADWPGPQQAHSFYYGNAYTQYCPPQPFSDDLGPVQLVMDATFSCEETSVEPSSWGAIETLFR